MDSHKATTHVAAIIWTDDRSSVSQGAYSKCRSVAFVVQIAYRVLNFKKQEQRERKQAHKEIYIGYHYGCVIQGSHNTCQTPGEDIILLLHIVAVSCGTYLPCKAFLFFWLCECNIGKVQHFITDCKLWEIKQT